MSLSHTDYRQFCNLRISFIQSQAFYLHYKLGILGKGASVQIRPSEYRDFGMSDKARQRQIDSLEKAGLIVAERGNGRCPLVQIVDSR